MNTKLLAAALLALSPILAVGQPQQPQKWSGLLQIEVNGDEPGASAVKGYANREVWALGDVAVTPNGAQFHLGIVVLPFKNGSQIAGYAISAEAYEYFLTDAFKQVLVERNINPAVRAELASFVDGARLNVRQSAFICEASGLEGAIKRLVADFNANSLQAHRVMFQKVIDNQKKAKQN
jgi:hypothetical protein